MSQLFPPSGVSVYLRQCNVSSDILNGLSPCQPRYGHCAVRADAYVLSRAQLLVVNHSLDCPGKVDLSRASCPRQTCCSSSECTPRCPDCCICSILFREPQQADHRKYAVGLADLTQRSVQLPATISPEKCAVSGTICAPQTFAPAERSRCHNYGFPPW